MAPTLALGERVATSRDADYVPQVGDVVVFHPPAGVEDSVCGDPDQGAGTSAACSRPTAEMSDWTMIKRIVAAPGDTLAIRAGRVVRNGELQDEPFVMARDDGDDFPTEITIAPDHYFLLGDNRAKSSDSRFWGPVPRAWIIGAISIPGVM
jgi:signal peptidase I